MELSSSALSAASTGAILRDNTVKGLHAKVGATAKVFFLYFRTKAGVERRPKLGEFPAMTVAQARAIAKEMLLVVAAGADPMEKRRQEREAPTLGEALDQFVTEHLSRRKTAAETERLLRFALPKSLLARKAASIEHADIQKLHQARAAKPYVANRELAHLSTLFNKLELWGYRPKGSNPCEGVERFPEKKRRRYMSAEEAQAVAAALDRRARSDPASVAFVYLLILTGARRGEIAAARWQWLDGNALHLPDSKTGAKTIFLPPQAMAVLDALPRTSGTLTGILSPTKMWQSVRVEAKCPDLRLHDLRHSFASAALDAGLSLSQIGELLGHASTQTTKRYAHLIDATAQAAVAKTAALVAANMGR